MMTLLQQMERERKERLVRLRLDLRADLEAALRELLPRSIPRATDAASVLLDLSLSEIDLLDESTSGGVANVLRQMKSLSISEAHSR